MSHCWAGIVKRTAIEMRIPTKGVRQASMNVKSIYASLAEQR
jgi:hypothetical protein